MSVSSFTLISQFGSLMRTLSQLGSQQALRLVDQVRQYHDLTDNQTGLMRLQGKTVLATTLLAGVSGIALGFFPKAISSPAPALDPRLDSNSGSGVGDIFYSIGTNLQNSEIIRPMLKVASKHAPAVGQGFSSLIQPSITEEESNRTTISQVHIPSSQASQEALQDASNKAYQLGISLIDKLGRGG